MTPATEPEVLSREEAVRQFEALLESVPDARRPGVAAWAVWGMAPWTSFSPYIRTMFTVGTESYGERFDALDRAVSAAAVARSLVADRRYGPAIEVAVQAVDFADDGGGGAVRRACEAILTRARLLGGRIADGLTSIEAGRVADDPSDPETFRAEALLTLGLADVIRGDFKAARTSFSAVTELVSGPFGELPGWQAARGFSGLAHVAFRSGSMTEAVEAAGRAEVPARAADARSELADLLLFRGVAGLAGGGGAPIADLQGALVLAQRLPSRSGAADLVLGVPVDLGCGADPGTLTRSFLDAARECADAKDGAGHLLVALAAAGVLAVAGQSGSAGTLLASLESAYGDAELADLAAAAGRARAFVAGRSQ